MTTTSAVNGPSRTTGPVDETSVVPSPPSDPPILPEPVAYGLGGDSMAALAALLTKADEQDRTQARALEQTADEAAMKEDNQQVDQMRQKADDDRNGAIWSGLGEVAGGAMAFTAAFVAPPASGTGATDWHGALDAGSKAMPGVGTIAAGSCKADGDQADANAAQFAAQSQAGIRSFDEAHDEEQAANDSLQKVSQFLDQVQQTQNATRLSAATCRG